MDDDDDAGGGIVAMLKLALFLGVGIYGCFQAVQPNTNPFDITLEVRDASSTQLVGHLIDVTKRPDGASEVLDAAEVTVYEYYSQGFNVITDCTVTLKDGTIHDSLRPLSQQLNADEVSDIVRITGYVRDQPTKHGPDIRLVCATVEELPR